MRACSGTTPSPLSTTSQLGALPIVMDCLPKPGIMRQAFQHERPRIARYSLNLRSLTSARRLSVRGDARWGGRAVAGQSSGGAFQVSERGPELLPKLSVGTPMAFNIVR